MSKKQKFFGTVVILFLFVAYLYGYFFNYAGGWLESNAVNFEIAFLSISILASLLFGMQSVKERKKIWAVISFVSFVILSLFLFSGVLISRITLG